MDEPAHSSPDGVSAVRDLLLAQRAQVRAQVTALTREFDGIVESVSGNTDDEHDPEGSTLAFERAQVMALRADALRRCSELDAALERLGRGDYGRCDRCGGPITAERLSARPAATTCIGCATAGPRGGAG